MVLGTGAQIEPDAQVLHVHTVTGEQQLAYDWLIYAVGSHGASQTPGVSEFAVHIADVDGAAEIARQMNTKDVRSVCVVGGGPAGVETAAELAEAHPATTVTLIAGSELVSAMRPAARKSVRRRLQRRGVTVLDSLHVLKVTPRGVHTDDGVSREFDLVVWAAGFEVPELAARSGLPVDSIGRLLVDDTLQCVADAHILGAGDAVAPPYTVSAHLPMGARTALPMGGAAADTLLAHLRHQNPRPISIGLLGPSISLGRRDGYVQLAHPDDTPTRIAVTGWAGAATAGPRSCHPARRHPGRSRRVSRALRLPRRRVSAGAGRRRAPTVSICRRRRLDQSLVTRAAPFLEEHVLSTPATSFLSFALVEGYVVVRWGDHGGHPTSESPTAGPPRPARASCRRCACAEAGIRTVREPVRLLPVPVRKRPEID